MISLCITGQSPSAIAAASAALEAAGMAPARGLERDAHINFSTWHERVYQALEQGDDGEDNKANHGAVVQGSIGRVWDQLATDLLLANMDSKVWGWADVRSLALLDYWLAFDPGIHFLLIAQMPQQYVADRLSGMAAASGQGPSKTDLESWMDQWQQSHAVMLRFALRNPTRCVLIQANDFPPHHDAVVRAVQSVWPRKLKCLTTVGALAGAKIVQLH